jgi:hypothetical protein
MADPVFYGRSRWLSVTVSEIPRARKHRFLLEVECAEGLALLPTPEAIVRTTVRDIAGPPLPLPLDAEFTGNGRHYLPLKLANRDLAVLAAETVLEAPGEWFYGRERLNDDDIHALCVDPIAAGLGDLKHFLKETQEASDG